MIYSCKVLIREMATQKKIGSYFNYVGSWLEGKDSSEQKEVNRSDHGSTLSSIGQSPSASCTIVAPIVVASDIPTQQLHISHPSCQNPSCYILTRVKKDYQAKSNPTGKKFRQAGIVSIHGYRFIHHNFVCSVQSVERLSTKAL